MQTDSGVYLHQATSNSSRLNPENCKRSQSFSAFFFQTWIDLEVGGCVHLLAHRATDGTSDHVSLKKLQADWKTSNTLDMQV